jgi:hypothetical protein
MKKIIGLVAGLAVVTAPAFASKARLQALGEDLSGSFFIDDNRNIFRNAALLNNYGDLVTYEWGDNNIALDDSGANAGLGALADKQGPRGEGGVFFKQGSYVYGVQLGDVSNDSHLFRAAALTTANINAANEQNNISFWLAGESSVKWGASLVYSKAENDAATAATAQRSSDAMRLRLGLAATNWEGFASINLGNEVENGDRSRKFKGDLGYQVGGIYKLDSSNTVWAVWRKLEGEEKVAKNDLMLDSKEIGWGRVEKMNDKMTAYLKASVNMLETENEASTGVFGGATCASGAASLLGCDEYSSTRVPVVVGMEVRATEWLSLRGSLGQNLYGVEEDKNKERSIAGSTIVSAGASFHLGSFDIDGMIGNNPDAGAPGAATGPGNNGTARGAGQLRTDSILSRVSMTYRW